MLRTDIPTQAEIRHLAARRDTPCISLTLPTGSTIADANRASLDLASLLDRALESLHALGIDRDAVEQIRARGLALVDDRLFWHNQARSLVVLISGDEVRTYRLPMHVQPSVHVADRFHLIPLLAAMGPTPAGLVLAVSQNSVRLIEVAGDDPARIVPVAGLPENADLALATRGDRASADISGDQFETERLGGYARQIRRAVRPIVLASHLPLILAAAEPLAGILRSIGIDATHRPELILGSPDRTTPDELADAARPVLDRLVGAALEKRIDRVRAAIGADRGSTDLSDLAHAAVVGSLELLLVSAERSVPGTVDPITGALHLAEGDDASPDVLNEIACIATLNGAEVIALAGDALPNGADAAGILRFPA
jgi:hypothetical protein